MPLYEYECEACHRRTEKIQKFSDPELTTCPHCGGQLGRTITAPAVQFKGAGWYKDLYSSSKPAAASGTPGDTGSSAPATEGAASAPAAAKSDTGTASSSSAPAAPASTSSST